MNHITFRTIPFGGEEYARALALREEVLRKPLGLTFSPSELEQERSHIHISGFLGSELCATAALVPQGTEAQMRRVAVRADLQGRGIGSLLMKFCESMARQNGFASIYCHARDQAVPFYLKNGYELEGGWFVEDTIRHHSMRKRLGGR